MSQSVLKKFRNNKGFILFFSFTHCGIIKQNYKKCICELKLTTGQFIQECTNVWWFFHANNIWRNLTAALSWQTYMEITFKSTTVWGKLRNQIFPECNLAGEFKISVMIFSLKERYLYLFLSKHFQIVALKLSPKGMAVFLCCTSWGWFHYFIFPALQSRTPARAGRVE